MTNLLSNIRRYSIPLILGVIIAVIWKNLGSESYDAFVEHPLFELGGLEINMHFLVNDVFMVFFFLIAGIEIVHQVTPGGNLYPLKRAVTPLMATAGGVLGPIAIFFILNSFMGSGEFVNGWGITTATDIALAWLLARIVFGMYHPAVSFLLLLAVADDGIGLAIIAIFYPDKTHPAHYQYLLFIVLGMLIAYILKKIDVKNWLIYVIGPGLLAWFGLYLSGLHPALALVFIVGFIPKPKHFTADKAEFAWDIHIASHSRSFRKPLIKAETFLAPIVDYGLIFFGLINAGVKFSNVSNLTFIITLSLIIGKTLGITLFSYLAVMLRFSLPKGMKFKEILSAGLVAGMGLTVALFVTESAFTEAFLKDPAKMGALFTAAVFILAPIVSKLLGVKRLNTLDE